MGKSTTRTARVILALAVILASSACSSGEFLTLTGDEIGQEPCATNVTIPVYELAMFSTRECDPVGSTVQFSDGTEITIGDGSGSSSDLAGSYSYHNVGTYGIVATRYHGECLDQQVWGPPAAIAKLTEAFGGTLGNC